MIFNWFRGLYYYGYPVQLCISIYIMEEHNMMSQYAEEIISVVRELKEIILTKLDNGEEVSTDELGGFTREAFQKTNIQFGVKESTVRDKCTRQIEANL